MFLVRRKIKFTVKLWIITDNPVTVLLLQNVITRVNITVLSTVLCIPNTKVFKVFSKNLFCVLYFN